MPDNIPIHHLTGLVGDDVSKALARHALASQDGDEALLDRVRARVMGAVAREPRPAPARPTHMTIRNSDGGWQQVQPGLTCKVLFEGTDSISYLMRAEPGTVVSAHAHPIDEECLVLEGTVRVGTDLLLHPGDFHLGRRGVDHGPISTDTGALVYLRCAKPEGLHV